MAQVTRTLHPLPLEHLEPKRFEDLVRQLIYDFRQWRQLEATGRGGSDDGFDARGYEIVDDEPNLEDDEDATVESGRGSDRLWLIQCKREQRIGPARLLQHLQAIPTSSLDGLHGIILAAACDFSKQTLDTFREWCRAKGIQECYLWGKAAIEDALFLPKNDHLLFAYFGISLQIRRQKLATGIRRTVSLKRRLNRHIPSNSFPGTPIILRDPSDTRYPLTDGETLRGGNFLWWPCYSKGVGPRGLLVIERQHLAYLDWETGKWDFASSVNLAIPPKHDNFWYGSQVNPDHAERAELARSFWWSLPDHARYHLFFVKRVSYERIIEIDDVGDRIAKAPTVFVEFQNGQPPLEGGGLVFSSAGSLNEVPFSGERHTRVFPDEFRDLDWEQGWFSEQGYSYSTEAAHLHQSLAKEDEE